MYESQEVDRFYIMQAVIEPEIELELEAKRMLWHFAQTIRCSKRRPELGRVMAKDEIRLKKEVEELEEKAAKQSGKKA